MADKRTLLIEGHHYVFSFLGKRFASDIEHCLIAKPQTDRIKYFRNTVIGTNGVVTREILLDYLKVLEGGMERILSKHSPFFWLFLYRRIKPTLDPRHDNKTDELTTLLVRNIVDLAIAKFANLEITNDMKPSSGMGYGRSWGGYLAKAIESLPKESKDQLLPNLLKEFESGDAFLPFSFRPINYRDIFEVEGLAYEYWLATARLRDVGKGSQLYFESTTGEFAYGADDFLAEPIKRFDERLGKNAFFTTLIGVTLSIGDESAASKSLSIVQYNVGERDISPILRKLGFNVEGAGGLPIGNFFPLFVSLQNLQESHSYLNRLCEDRWGFTFEDLAQVLWALANLALVPNKYLADKKYSLGYHLYNLLQRGYALYDSSGDQEFGSIRQRMNLWMKLEDIVVNRIMKKVPAIVKMISLSADKQATISLWSGGPRPLIIPHGNFIIIDVAGFVEFLMRVFTGLRDDGQIRGDEFEQTVRDTIVGSLPAGFQIGPREIKERGKLIDEIDLLLRKDDEVYVCECFTMWRPLDIEIGHPSRIKKRLEQVDKKLDQAENSCRYFQENRTGPNFDYSTVRRFVPIVVSPFVEWLPSTAERYWISEDIPRVMTLDELSGFLASR